MFNAFVSTCEVSFHTTHQQNKTRMLDTEGLITVEILCGVVSSLSWFTKCLIGRTGNILSVLYINKTVYICQKLVRASYLNVL